MPRRKSFRKRYNKSKQTRRIRKMRKMKTRKLTGGTLYSKAMALGSSLAYKTIRTKYQEVVELRKLNMQIEKQHKESLNNLGLWDLDATIISNYNSRNYNKSLSQAKRLYIDWMFKSYETNEDFKKLVIEIVNGQHSYNSIYYKMYGDDISLLIKQIGDDENKESIISKFTNIKSKVDTFIESLKLLRESYQYKYQTGSITSKEDEKTWTTGWGADLLFPGHYKDTFVKDMEPVYKLQKLLEEAIAKFEGNTDSNPVMTGEEQTEEQVAAIQEQETAVPETREQKTTVPETEQVPEPHTEAQKTEPPVGAPETAVQVPETAVQEKEPQTEQESETKSASGGKRRLRKSRKTKK